MKRFIRVYGSGSGSVRHPGVGTSPANHQIHAIPFIFCGHIFGILYLCGAAQLQCSV